MSGQTHESDAIDLAVRLSEEIDAEEVLATVDAPDEKFKRFLGRNLTSASFTPTVEAATDIVIAHGARVPASASRAMINGADRALQERRADIEAAAEEERNYTL